MEHIKAILNENLLVFHSSVPQSSSLCSGPLSPLWLWLTNHCRPEDTVRSVLGNLALARRTAAQGEVSQLSLTLAPECEEREVLAAERGRLVQELHGVLAKIARLRNVLEGQERERTRQEGERGEGVRAVQQRRQRAALLGLYCRQVQAKMDKLDRVSQRLEEVVRRRSLEETGHERTYSSGQGLESEHGVRAREAVAVVLEQMKAVLDRRKEREGFGRAEAKQKVLSLLESRRPGAVLLCLVDQVQEARRLSRRQEEEVEGGQENQRVSLVDIAVSGFCSLHLASREEVARLRSSAAKLEQQLAAEQPEKETAERTKRRAEALSLRESSRMARRQVAELEAAKEGLAGEERVAEQERMTEELCKVISLLVAR